VKLSNLVVSPYNKKDLKEKLDEKKKSDELECSDKTKFGVFSLTGDKVRKSREPCMTKSHSIDSTYRLDFKILFKGHKAGWTNVFRFT